MGADLAQNVPLVDGTRGSHESYRVTDCALLLSATAIVCLPGTSNDSLWIDEGGIVWAVSFSSVGLFIHKTMLNCRGSIAQTPFHNFYLWAWLHIFGMGEVALRLSNVPLVLLLLFAHIFVPPEFRGLRIAQLLLRSFCEEMRKIRVPFCQAHIAAHNAPSRAFLKCGLASIQDYDRRPLGLFVSESKNRTQDPVFCPKFGNRQ